MGRRKPKPFDSQLPVETEHKLRRLVPQARVAVLADCRAQLRAIAGLTTVEVMRTDLERKVRFLRHLQARRR